MNEARVAVGSMPPANWVVQGPTVAPQHFEFYWDGTALWISPPQGGDVTVDGERIQTWRQLVGRSRLEFGGAAMLVETSAAVAAVGAQQGAVQGQAAAQPAAPAAGYTGPPPPMAGPSTARFDDSTPLLPENMLEPLEGDSTRMLEMPEVRGSSLPPPSLGGVSLGQAGGMPPPFEFESGPATQVFDPAAAGIEMPQSVPPPAPAPAPAAPASPGHSGLKSSAMSTDVLPGRAQASGGPSSRFKAPPPPAEPKKSSEGTSKRSLLLAAALLVMALVWLGVSYVRRNQRAAALQASRAAALAGEEERAREAIAQAAAAAQEANAERSANEAILITRAEESTAALREAARAEVEESYEEPAEDEEPVDLEALMRDAERRAIHRFAASVAARNDYRPALGLYLLLNREFPSDPNYPQIVEILRQKVRCEGTNCE